jgi:hypothetical protein
MAILDRAGAFVREVLFEKSELFTINGNMVFLAMGVCVFLFLWARALYRSYLSVSKIKRHIAGAAMYLNVISIVVLWVMILLPSLHFRYSPI